MMVEYEPYRAKRVPKPVFDRSNETQARLDSWS